MVLCLPVKMAFLPKLYLSTSPSLPVYHFVADHKGGFQGGAQHFEAVLHEMRIVARLARNRVKLKIIGMNREAKLCKRDHDDSMPKLEKVAHILGPVPRARSWFG